MSGPKNRSGQGGLANPWVPAGVPAQLTRPGELPKAPIIGPTYAAQGGEGAPVHLVQASDPTSGTTTVPGGPQWTPICDYRTFDNVPRKATICVAPRQIIQPPGNTSFSTVQGVYTKITYGTQRGRAVQIVGSPCMFPIEGSYVKVEAMIGDLPYQLGLAGAVSVSSFSSQFQCSVTAMVIDGWTDDGPAILFARDAPCGNVFVPQVGLGGVAHGLPAIIDLICLSNTNATGTLQMRIADSIVGANGFSVFVDAQTSTTVTRDMLGPFFSGVSIESVTGDSTDQNVLATVWGRYLLQGGA
jgi:hypothetical protein